MTSSLQAVVVDCRNPQAQAASEPRFGKNRLPLDPVTDGALEEPEGNVFCAASSFTVTGWA